MVALQAGQALQRARLYDATERLATTDGLTGLTNHRTFQGRLDEHLGVSQRYGRKVSLILCDIDHFKSVNDTYGHPVGDLVLKGVARILAKEARATDVVARYGGEEFAVVMPETDTAARAGGGRADPRAGRAARHRDRPRAAPGHHVARRRHLPGRRRRRRRRWSSRPTAASTTPSGTAGTRASRRRLARAGAAAPRPDRTAGADPAAAAPAPC